MKRVYATLTALALVAACAENPVGIEVKTAAFTKAPISAQEVTADMVAQAIALAMKDVSIRAAVRDAMRASPLTEHKLRFHDFVQTSTGQALLRVGAERTHMTMEALEEMVAQLPPLDFYVPAQGQRRSWRGEATVHVGYFLDHDARNARAYDTNGVAVGLYEKPGVGNATFVLQLAERTSRRIHSQRMIPSSVIEDMDDGMLSGSVVDYLPDGTTRVTELADLYVEIPTSVERNLLAPSGELATILAPARPKYIIPCDEPGGLPCGGGGGPYSPPDTTFLQDVSIISVCDNYGCLETNEFEWHTYFSTNNGSTWTDRRDIRIEGVYSVDDFRSHIPALFRKLRSSNERIQSDVVETDIWSDDHFGSPQWSLGANGMMRFQGASKCGVTITTTKDWGPTPPPYVIECTGGSYGGGPYQYLDWKEVNQSMVWNP